MTKHNKYIKQAVAHRINACFSVPYYTQTMHIHTQICEMYGHIFQHVHALYAQNSGAPDNIFNGECCGEIVYPQMFGLYAHIFGVVGYTVPSQFYNSGNTDEFRIFDAFC